VVTKFYAGLDIGSSVCELVAIDEAEGQPAALKISTSGPNLLAAIRDMRRAHPGEWWLAVEEGELAQWVADLLRAEVDRLIVCDPKRNAWIARDPGKHDRVDATKLAKLLKGGFLAPIYHSADASRVDFKRAVQHYHDLTRTQAALKCQIKSRLRAYGIVVRGSEIFGAGAREEQVKAMPTETGRQLLRQMFELLDQAARTQQKARHLMTAMGRAFPEVARFEEVPGIGSVWACTFSAYIQTPQRFHSKRQLWRYCRLGITNRQSNGEPLGRQRLDSGGVGILKSLSFQAFCAARAAGENEFDSHYEESLARTGDKTHARLNTQRHILAVLYGMWKRNEPYRPNRAKGGTAQPKEATTPAELR